MSEIPTIKPRRKGRSGMQAMLIPSRGMVAEQIRSAPEGVVTEAAVIRRRLAAQYGADACCPVTVQRHLRVIAELSFGRLEKGEALSAVTPYLAHGRSGEPACKTSCRWSCLHSRAVGGRSRGGKRSRAPNGENYSPKRLVMAN
ncbi:hypothetical protein RCCGEPOP_07640 [Rhizobium sp. Pop5]|nr:hypothetical protein RCCGEPOP_07640 [Rhizobium sp. Pop5]